MKSKMKNLEAAVVFLLLSIVSIGSACTEKDDIELDEPHAQSSLSAEAQSSEGSMSNSNERVIINGFAASEFKVGTKEIEMKYAAKADILAGIGIGNISLRSNVNAGLQTAATRSQTIGLIANGEFNSTKMGEGSTPEGNYMEVNFRLFKNTEVSSTDPMFEKSMMIVGETEGSLTEIWLNSEKMLRAKAASSQGVEVEGETEMVIVFDMDQIFAGIDFSTAVASETDGKIEIGPNSTGPNAAIFSQIETNLESAVSLRRR